MTSEKNTKYLEKRRKQRYHTYGRGSSLIYVIDKAYRSFKTIQFLN